MPDTVLVIADKNYSLWPLAPWLMFEGLKYAIQREINPIWAAEH